ncbi:DUF2306 domain-containing protein [Streptomyces sanyensis]|uniref:DUF2306 domain-containing protein n=1 Tax=Streptomyces sanyensis TaxID=568869 RepID=UPI003D77AC76
MSERRDEEGTATPVPQPTESGGIATLAGSRSAPPPPRRPPARSRTGWTLVLLSSLAVAAFSVGTYAAGSLESLAEDGVGLSEAYAAAPAFARILLYVHIATAALALLLGPFQFSRALRRRSPRAHRAVGRVYLVSVLLGAVSGVLVTPWNSAGMAGFFGFGGLSVLWAVTAVRGYRAARRGDIAHHQAWMIRNFAFTYAAPALRLWLGLLILVQAPFHDMDTQFDMVFDNAYHAVPFLAWVPNMFVAEWLIRRRNLPSYRLPPPASARRGR